jgi:phosphate transport system substrate-binding protein
MRSVLPRILCAAGLLALAACERQAAGPQAPARTLTYDGATTISSQLLPLALPILAQRHGIQVEVRRSGAGKGLKALFAGQVDVAGMSRPLTAQELQERPFVAIVGYDALGVWVSTANPVKALTSAQLRDLFTGRVTNWRQVGGRDMPVVPCTEHVDSERATVSAFRQLALDGASFGKVRELEDPFDCLRLALKEPGVVTPATTTYGIPGVRTVAIDGLEPVALHVRNSTYLLTRPLLLVARTPPTGALKELFDFVVSAEGQALVVQAGFVPAR